MQAQVRRGGPGQQGDGQGPQPWRCNLDHKSGLKEYNGDRKAYRGWSKKLMAFCNSKQAGFRKALIPASKQQAPITEEALRGTGWEHSSDANSKLYDLLIGITASDVLLKVETTPGEDQGFESWRRLGRQYDPASCLTKIDKINARTRPPATR